MDRRTALRRVGIILVALNIALVAAKAAVWTATGSLAVGSEAVNSLADAVYSAVVLAGLYLTTRPPDFEHPHGHERIEPFVSLLVAVGVFAAGAGVLYRSVAGLLAAPGSTPGAAAAAVLAGGAVAKFLMYRYCLRVGRRHDSPAVIAAGLDNRVDVLTAGTALAGVVGSWFGYPALDPLAAGLVAIGILYTGVEIARDNVGYLVGKAPEEELRTEILRRALEHPDVEGAHDVVAHYVGPEVDVSLHVEVEGDLTVAEAHSIETSVMERIRTLDEIDDVFVHVDPRELGEWDPEAVDESAIGTGEDDLARTRDPGNGRDPDTGSESGG